MINTMRTKVFEIANKFDIKVGYSGHVIAGPEWSREDDSTPYSKLYFLMDGTGYLLYKGERIEMHPGNVYFIPYELKHGLLCESSLEKMYFHFTLTDSVGIDLLDGIEGIHSMPMDINIIRQIKDLYFKNDLGSWLMLKSIIYKTAWNFIEKTGLGGSDYERYSEKTRAAMRYIRENLSISLGVEQIADALCISSSTLSKHFLNETGVSIGKFIDRQVLVRARQLLIGSDVPLCTISERLGFCDQFYFARKFKSYYRLTPTSYRKQHRKF